MSYGIELVLDLHKCDAGAFNRESLKRYFTIICTAIKMRRCKLVFWDDVGVPEKEKQTLPHTKGTSAVQFILTSNITVHTLDDLKAVYINIFSCNYPVQHPEYCGCSSCEKYKQWLKEYVCNFQEKTKDGPGNKRQII